MTGALEEVSRKATQSNAKDNGQDLITAKILTDISRGDFPGTSFACLTNRPRAPRRPRQLSNPISLGWWDRAAKEPRNEAGAPKPPHCSEPSSILVENALKFFRVPGLCKRNG
jgi:hypothetical protein